MNWAFLILYYTDIDQVGQKISRLGGMPKELYLSTWLLKHAAPREKYIVTRENMTLLAPWKRNISSVPVNICYIRWSKYAFMHNSIM